jgi:hypothetical protein
MRCRRQCAAESECERLEPTRLDENSTENNQRQARTEYQSRGHVAMVAPVGAAMSDHADRDRDGNKDPLDALVEQRAEAKDGMAAVTSGSSVQCTAHAVDVTTPARSQRFTSARPADISVVIVSPRPLILTGSLIARSVFQ